MKIILLSAFHPRFCGCFCTLSVSGHTHGQRNVELCSLMEPGLVELPPAKLPEVTMGTSECPQPPYQGRKSHFGKRRDCFAEQG